MRKFVALVVTLCALLAFPSLASSETRTFYVSPSGSDGASGASNAPFRTLARGMTALAPGDTLVVRGGDYVERIKNPGIVAGTTSAPITVVAAPGERPVVHGLLWLSNASHWVIDGIDVTWSSANGPTEHMVKMSNGTGWRITGSELWGAQSYAALLVAGTAAAYSIDNNYIHDTHATNDTNQDHLIYVSAGVGNGVIENNVLANSPNGRGIKVGPSSASTVPVGGVTIRNNTFFNNTGPSSIQLSYGATGNLIERNVMQRPRAGRAAITAYNVNGSGNVVRDNVAWEAEAVAEFEPGVADGGGNVLADPAFVDPAAGDFRIGNLLLAGYGALASALEPPAPTTSTTSTTVAPTTSTTSTTSTTVAPAPTTSTTVAPAPTTTTTAPAATPRAPKKRQKDGYRLTASDGGIFSFGDAPFLGSTGDISLNQPITAAASTPTGDGYWLVARDGGIFTFGDAGFHGSAGGMRLSQPVVAIAATPTGDGYWLVARDGAVFAFGDAGFHGSAAGRGETIVAMAATPTGGGYWLASANGRIHAFGDAGDFGSTGPLNQPIVAMAPTTSGRGYRLVGRDGGIFCFGDAEFFGSTGGMRLNQPVITLQATDAGYRLVAADGGIFSFGDAPFHGSTGAMRLNQPIVTIV